MPTPPPSSTHPASNAAAPAPGFAAIDPALLVPRKPLFVPADTPRWLLAALALCLVVGLARIFTLWAHTPLIALANSYDEVRYSACFDLYPDRDASIPPTRNSPEAPFARYRFISNASPICYWSTELGFQGAAALVYRVQQAMTGEQAHSVRWIGAFKIAALLALWCAFGVAWLRRREPWSALANGLLLPVLFADPAATIYLNTYYAEWTALLALYALVGLLLLHEGKPARGRAWGLLALAAFALALSKIQHIVLPLGCALVVLALGWWRERTLPWQGRALLLGAVLGLGVQVVQLQRDSDAIRAINVFNQADVVFTGVLPNSSHPLATALGPSDTLDPHLVSSVHTAAARALAFLNAWLADERFASSCLQYAGLRAWQMPGFPADLCPELRDVTRGRELAVLLREPDLTLRLGWQGLSALTSWVAPGLGLVEGGNFAPLPADFFSLSAWLATPLLRLLLLGVPFVAMAGLLLTRRWRNAPRLYLMTALTLIVTLGTLTVTVLGDGLADVPKQGHLIFAMALAWWVTALVLGGQRLLQARRAVNQAP